MTRHFQAPLPSPSAEEEKRERRLSSRASRLETSGVRLCARRPASGGIGEEKRGQERREATTKGGQSGRHQGRMLCPRARAPARSHPPGRAPALTLRGRGELPASGDLGSRPPRSPPSLALQPPPPPPSLSFPRRGPASCAVALRSRPAGGAD